MERAVPKVGAVWGAALEGLGPPALIALEGTRAVQAAAPDKGAAPDTSLGRPSAAVLRGLSGSYLVARPMKRALAFRLRH